MIAARLQAYASNGAVLGEMPYPLTIDPMVVHNDVGSLAFSYSDLAAGGAHLATALQSGLEVALEISKGEKDAIGRDVWVEPKGCRFVRLEDDTDPSDPTKRVSLTLPSFGWLLSKCVVGADGAVDGLRVFEEPTVGEILLTLLDENEARGGYATSVSPTFTATTDSAGVAWPVLDDMAFNVGDDYLTVLDGLTAAGGCDWTTQARGLYCYVPDSTTLSPDLSGGVVLSLGTDVAGAPTKRSIANMAGRVLVMAAAGGVTMAEEPTAVTGWGIPESTLRIGQVSGEPAGIAAGEAELERVGRPQGQFTRELILAAASKVPLLDYWPGCWITAPGAAGAGEKLRVQQATFSFQGLDSTGSLTLNDLLLEADERRARTLASLAGGTVSPGGPGAPISVDPEASRVPSTPTGFDIIGGLTFTGPTPRGVVTATWNPVSTATDSGALTISGYEFQYRVAAGAWQTRPTPEVSATVTDLTPGAAVDSRVRAVGARTTLPSAWSAIDSVTVPGDVTAPAVPSIPTLASALRVVSIAWDGTLAAAIPADFAYVEVALGPALLPTTVVGTLNKAGTLQVAGQTIGATVRARLRAVDTTGNTSAWSTASAAIVVAGVKGPDLEANSVTANTIAVGALDGKVITGTTIRTAAAGARVELSGTSMKSIDASNSTRAELNSAGLTVYQGGNLDVVYPSGRAAVDFASFNAQTWWGLLVYADSASNPDILRAYYNTTGNSKHVYVGHESSPVADFTVYAAEAVVYASGSGGLYLENNGTGSSYLRADGGGSAAVQARTGTTLNSEFVARQSGETTMRGFGAGHVFVRNDGTGDAYVQATGGGNAYLTSDSGQAWIGSTTSTTVRNTGASGLIELQVTNSAATVFRSRIQAGTGQAVLIAYDGAGVQTGRLDVSAEGVRIAGYSTSSAAANVRMGDTSPNTGRLYQVTSSLRYKQDVEPLDLDGLTADAVVDALTGFTWRDRAEVAENPDATMRYPGLIAEYMHDAGLGTFVEYDLEGRPSAVMYDRTVTALAQALKATRTALTALAAQVGQEPPAVALMAAPVPTSSAPVVAMKATARKAAGRPAVDRPEPSPVATPTDRKPEERTRD